MARRKIKEGHLGDMAYKAEMDHEVQMARSDLYKVAKYAVELHDMLKSVSEAEGIEGWQQAKITKAADYIGSVYHSMDYEAHVASQDTSEEMPIAEADQINELDIKKRITDLVAGNPLAKKIATKAGAAAGGIRLTGKIRSIKKIHNKLGKEIELLGPKVKLKYEVFKTRPTQKEAEDAAGRLSTLLRRGEIAKFAPDEAKKADMYANNLIKTMTELADIPAEAKGDLAYLEKIADTQANLQKLITESKKIINKTLRAKGKHDANLAALLMAVAVLYGGIALLVQSLGNNDDKIDEDDVEEGNAFGHAARQAKLDGKDEFEVDGKTYKVQEGKKKAKPDYLDFDGDGNKKESMKKALKDKKKSANESMLRTITQAINYKAGKIGAANVTPKAMNLAETMITKDLKRLQADFKKRVISNGTPQSKITPLQVNEGQYGEITHTDEDATQSEVLVKGMGVYRMDQLEQRLKDRLNNVLQLIDRGEPDQAAKLLDPNSSTYKSLMVMMNAFAEAHDELAFGDHSMGAGINESATVCKDCGKPSWRTMSKEELDEAHGNDSRYDKCWKGCRKVPGKKRGEKGSCKCP